MLIIYKKVCQCETEKCGYAFAKSALIIFKFSQNSWFNGAKNIKSIGKLLNNEPFIAIL